MAKTTLTTKTMPEADSVAPLMELYGLGFEGGFKFNIRSALTQIVDIFRLRLQAGYYGTGDRLPPEREIAEEFGVGRPLIRKALAVLREEGYLIAKRGAFGGHYVTDLEVPTRKWLETVRADNGAHLLDVIDLRMAVETRAAELAAERRTAEEQAAIELAAAQLNHLLEVSLGQAHAQTNAHELHRADFRFHEMIAKSSHSASVVTAMAQIRGLTFLARPVAYKELKGTVEDHSIIFRAIRVQDPHTAASAMRRHLDHVKDSYLRLAGEGDGRGRVDGVEEPFS